MSGHSKWANIKNKKAKTDSQKAVVFQKYSRELIVAARLGGPDPAGNFRLRTAIEKAKAAGLPNDNIKRAIDKGAGAGAADNYEELTYEGYAAGGVAVVLEAMTDNRNRTAGDVRSIFTKFNGNLGETGCVGWMFDKKGCITFDSDAVDYEALFEAAINLDAEDIVDEAGNVLVEANHLITPRRVDNIVKAGIKKAKIRTILTCKCKNGICSKCYGSNLATGEAVQVGEAVGIIAAQSIGEPGTQLTMRNFHSGGIAGGDDITQGLPRVEELFEARKPKRVAILSEIDGLAQIKETKKKREVVVTNEETGEIRTYPIPFNSRIMIDDIDGKGQMVKTGDVITDGSVDPHDLLRIQGVRSVQDYILREVQSAYRLQGVELNDKHIEVIVRQMLKKVRVEEAGDTDFLPGTMVDALELEEVNERLESEGKKPAEITKEILGISKAALATSSFLSAASFQETTKVLTEAAIKGKVDPLIGLKENVIIGKLIPAGTGMKRYQNVVLDTSEADTTDVADALEDAYEEAEVSAEITEE